MTFTRTNDRELDIDDQLRLSFASGCRAFDREFFTTDQEYRLQVNPSFETRSDLLQQTIVNRLESGFRFSTTVSILVLSVNVLQRLSERDDSTLR